MSIGFYETLAAIYTDGAAAITAVGPTDLLTGTTGLTGRYTMPPNRLRVGDVLHWRMFGRISCVVTTPGTAKFRLLAGVGGTVIIDTGAIPLNVVAQTTQPWILDIEAAVRTAGNAATLFPIGTFASQAVIGGGTQGAASGSPTVAVVPWNVAPVAGPTWDSTIAQILTADFTQTVTTGSLTLHGYVLALKTSSGF